MLFLDRLDRVVRDAPERRALVAPTRSGGRRALTFGELDDRARRLATVLRTSGLGRGSVVLVVHPATVELYATMVALFRLGAAPLFVEPPDSDALIAEACALRPPDAVVGAVRAQLLGFVSPAVRHIPRTLVLGRLRVPGALRLSPAGAERDRWPVGALAGDAAMVTVTRGADGRARAASRTHAALAAFDDALAASVGARAGDVELVAVPLVALANLAAGATSVLPDADPWEPERASPARLLRQIARERLPRATVTPALLERIVEGVEGGGASPDSLGAVVVAGGLTPPDLFERAGRALPEAALVALHETADGDPIARLDADEVIPDDRRRLRDGGGLLAGYPLAGVSLRVLAADGAAPAEPPRAAPRITPRVSPVIAPTDDAPLTAAELARGAAAPNVPGEIIAAAPHLIAPAPAAPPLALVADAPGEDAPEADAPDGAAADPASDPAAPDADTPATAWQRTGDVGYLDEAGRLWLLGRARVTDRRGVLYPLAAECAARDVLRGRPTAVALHQGERVLVVEAPPQAVLPKVASLGASLRWAAIDTFARAARLPLDPRDRTTVDRAALAALLGAGLDVAAPDDSGWLRLPGGGEG